MGTTDRNNNKNVIDLFVKLVRNIEILQMIFETKRE